MTQNQAINDADARRRISEDFDSTFFVEAAAGTGKTTVLVNRIIDCLDLKIWHLDHI